MLAWVGFVRTFAVAQTCFCLYMNWNILLCWCVAFVLGASSAQAQALQDSVAHPLLGDSASVHLNANDAPGVALKQSPGSSRGLLLPFQPNPKKSALYSAILPGAGQLYNRQYWKIPIVYVGVGVATYFLIDNSMQYQRYRRAYVSRINNPNYQDEFTGVRGINDLKILQDYYKKNLDMTILLTTVGYTLQVLDALAFAHLKNFDIGKDISLRMQPVALPNGAVGMGLAVRF